jgi:diguanylate cyclase (GGDEF)-like protein
MWSLLHASFGTRVARRTFGLFVVSALLPLALAGLVVERGVTEKLTAEAELRLRDAAKNYGLAVFERLEVAAEQLRWRASGVAVAGQGSSGPMFRAAAIRSADGETRLLYGSTIPAAAVLAARRALDAAGSETAIAEAPGYPPGTLLLAVPAPSGVAVGLLKDDYVWSRVENNPADMDFCVGLPSGAEHCPAGATARADRVLEGSWRMFMRARFGHGDWEIRARQPADIALESLRALHHSWPLVFAGAILLSVLLSLVQIRRRHAPLEQLLDATRRMEQGQLGAPVVVESDDEYALVGRALGRASSALRDQLELRDVLSQVDRSVIDARPLDSVLPGLLPAVSRLLGDGGALVMLVSRTGQGLRLLSWTGRLQDWSVASASDAFLAGVVAGRVDRNTAGIEQILGPVCGPDTGITTWWPCLDGDRLLGAVGCPGAGAGAGESVDAMGRQLATHLTVALADAERREDLLHQAYYDRLTGLPNRRLLLERLHFECSRALHEGRFLAALLVDLDKFKVVNDSLGHSAGDRVLETVAARLQQVVPAAATVARLGGDEFGVLLPDLLRTGDASAVAVAIQDELSRSFNVGGQRPHCSVSIGIATFPDGGADAEGLLRNASTAVSRAKGKAPGTVTFFEEGMNKDLQRRIYLEAGLREALRGGGIVLAYQPKLELATGRLAGAEALARWTHPTEGNISPGEFVPVAEEYGLMAELGWAVLETACRQLAQWRDRQLESGSVAVNVSVKQFANPRLADEVVALLASHQLSASSLEIEITESVLEDRYGDVIRQLKRLREAGIRISLDDFGTGYSALSSLQRLPVDVLKVDQSFVREMATDPDARAIVRAIVTMGRAIGKRIVAEGVETPEQLALLEDFGCDEVQGYLFARPLAAASYEAEWLAATELPAAALKRRHA